LNKLTSSRAKYLFYLVHHSQTNSKLISMTYKG
jgi:hypothetical protein